MDQLIDTLRRIENIEDFHAVPTSALLTMHTMITVVLSGLAGRPTPTQAIRAEKALVRVEEEIDARIPPRRAR